MMSMLNVAHINQYYGGSHILRDVSLMGLVPIKTGTIEFDGKALQNFTPYERAQAGIGFVPQGCEIFSSLTVEENLRMGLAYKPAGTPIPPELFELFPVFGG